MIAMLLESNIMGEKEQVRLEMIFFFNPEEIMKKTGVYFAN